MLMFFGKLRKCSSPLTTNSSTRGNNGDHSHQTLKKAARGVNLVFWNGCEEYMRGHGEGCLATELQVIMALCEARGGSHNAKQSVTGRLCQFYEWNLEA